MIRAVFGKRDLIDLMNSLAPSAFAWFQETLLNDVVRMITASTDRSEINGQRNLSLESLISALDPTNDPNRYNRIQNDYRSLKAKGSSLHPIKAHRHKRLMHFDESVADAGMSTLPSFSLEDIEDAVKSIGSLMSQISMYLNKSEIAYQLSSVARDAGEFEWMLRHAIRLREAVKKAEDRTVTDQAVRKFVLDSYSI